MVVARCENLTRLYRHGDVTVEALRGVTLSVQAGQTVCVLGRSGSGKSTLLGLMGCLDRPTSGRLFIGDQEASALSDSARVRLRRERLGFVFQSMNMVESLTALENVALPLRYAGVGPQRYKRARLLLERVGLAQRADFLPHQLSGGEQQRVAVARALVGEPLLVLADEPTGELDSASAADIAALIDEMRRVHGTAFLVATHDERLAAVAGRVLHMDDGRLREDRA